VGELADLWRNAPITIPQVVQGILENIAVDLLLAALVAE